MSAIKRIDAIDGLRGIAAMGVVLFHLRPQLFWLWTMVDLFFVISGFVITRLLLTLPELSGHILWNFWLRRGLRIWPLYFFTLILTLCIGSWLHRTGLEGPSHWGDIWKFFFFLQFIELYEPGTSLQEVAYIRNFLPSWSLAVEEQFYLLWPLLLALLRPYARAFWIACVGLVVTALYVRTGGTIPYVLTARMDGLALGAMAAWLVYKQDTGKLALSDRHLNLLLIACLIIGVALALPYLVAGFQIRDVKRMFFDYPLALPLLGFNLIYVTLILFIGLKPNNSWHRPLSSSPMVYLGSISFAIYMFHSPMMGWFELALHQLEVRRSLLSDVALTLSIIAVAHLSREWLELPFNRLKDKLPLASRFS